MKKLLIGIIALLGFLTIGVKAVELPEVTDHEKVTINVFRGSGCSHCYEALTYFNEVASAYSDYIDFDIYEVWENADNSQLFNATASYMDEDLDKLGVPYIVVGESYHYAGFASSLGEEIINAALAEYENDDYYNPVLYVAEENGLSYNATSLKEACVEEGIIESDDMVSTSKKDNSNDAIIVIGIFAVAIGGVVALVVCSRNKK